MNNRRHPPAPGHPGRAQLAALLDGPVRGRGGARLQAHLAHCAQCRRQVEQWRTMWVDLPDRAAGRPAPDLWPALRPRLGTSSVVVLPQPRWRLAASFAAGLMAGLLIWRVGTGGIQLTTAAESELLAQETVFSYLDPIPPESLAGRYLSLLPLGEEDPDAPNGVGR